MRKVMVVAVREYQAAVRTKAFIITLIAMPVLAGGSILAQGLLKDRVDTKDKQFAVVDRTPGMQLYEALADAARARNESEIFLDLGVARRQVKPRFVIAQPEELPPDPAEATLALSGQVRDGKLFGFVIIGANVITAQGDPTEAQIAYHSNSPTYTDFQRWVHQKLNARIHELRLAAAHLDPAVVREAMRYTPVTNLGLVSRDDAGEITEARETNELANLLLPLGLMMLMFMVLMITAPPLVNTVLEEKMQRIAEVLLGSIPPFQLMMGKLLGTVGVSLTIATVYLAGAYYALQQTGFAHFFPASMLGWFVLYQVLAVLMFGSLFIAIGAAVSDLKESQSAIMPAMVLAMIPFFVWINVVKEPNSTFSVIVSLFPPATPVLMLIRQTVPPGIPFWQPIVGTVGVLVTTTFFVLAAGRIFRIGILIQGKAPRLGEVLRWIVRG